MDAYLEEHKIPTNDPKLIAANSELYNYFVKPLPTKRPMSPELEKCVQAIVKHGIELLNALVFCITERDMAGKTPQTNGEPTKLPKKQDSRGNRENRDRRDHREDRKRITKKPLQLPLQNIDDPERESVNSVYDKVLLTINPMLTTGFW